MPLNTRILRDGEPLQLRWSDFHVAAMICASTWDAGVKGPFTNADGPLFEYGPECSVKEWANKTHADYPAVPAPLDPGLCWQLTGYSYLGMSPLNTGPYTLKKEHRFLDVTDGEVLHLLPGDVLKAWRS